MGLVLHMDAHRRADLLAELLEVVPAAAARRPLVVRDRRRHHRERHGRLVAAHAVDGRADAALDALLAVPPAR